MSLDKLTTTPEGEEKPIAYVRAVKSADLRGDAPAPEDEVLYAVHDGEGRPLALFKDRDTAMIVTRSHNYTPVSVH